MSLKSLPISKYGLAIVGIYVVLFPLFLVFVPHVFHYSLALVHPWYVALAIAITFLGFFLSNQFFRFLTIGWQGRNLSQGLLTIVYALLFAVPEEIIFRGIVQGFLQGFLQNKLLSVVVASAVFGLAHLPNGSRGLSIRKWNWQFAGVTFLAGLPLGTTFALTQSLFVPTLLHAFFLIFLRLFTGEAASKVDD